MPSADDSDLTVWLPTIISQAAELVSSLNMLAAQVGNSWISSTSISSRIGEREQQELERMKVTDCCQKLRSAVNQIQMKMKKLDTAKVSRYRGDTKLDIHSEEFTPGSSCLVERVVALSTAESRSDKNATNDSRKNLCKSDDLEDGTPVSTASEESPLSEIQQLQRTSSQPIGSDEEVTLPEFSSVNLQNEDEKGIEQMGKSNETPLKNSQENESPNLKFLSQPQRNAAETEMSAANVSGGNGGGNLEDQFMTSPPVSPKRFASDPQKIQEGLSKSGEKQLTFVSTSVRKPSKLKLKPKRSVDLNEKARNELLNDSEDSDESFGNFVLSQRVKKTAKSKENRIISLGLKNQVANCFYVFQC